MSIQQAEQAFHIKMATGMKPWMVPNMSVRLPEEFGNFLEFYDKLTAEAVDNEAKSRCRIDALIFITYQTLLKQGLLPSTGRSTATLSFETPIKWSPVPINGHPHTCIGSADYTVRFGEKDHMACHLVVLEAKKRGNMSGMGQLLAHMAMISFNRRTRGQSDLSIWGCLSDGWSFQFCHLDNDGEYSEHRTSAHTHGWQHVFDILAEMIIRAQRMANSPLRLSLSSTATENDSARNSLAFSASSSVIRKRKSTIETLEPEGFEHKMVDHTAKRQRVSLAGSEECGLLDEAHTGPPSVAQSSNDWDLLL